MYTTIIGMPFIKSKLVSVKKEKAKKLKFDGNQNCEYIYVNNMPEIRPNLFSLFKTLRGNVLINANKIVEIEEVDIYEVKIENFGNYSAQFNIGETATYYLEANLDEELKIDEKNFSNCEFDAHKILMRR